MPDIESLRRLYGGDDLDFRYSGDRLIKALVKNRAASGEVYLHGATVTAYQPAGHDPVLFVSSESFFKPDKAIRGGVPVCWPWFGPHPTDPRQPQHGRVRNREWNLAHVATIDPQRKRLKFECKLENSVATLVVTFGPTLLIELLSRNTGNEPMRLEEALHTYLCVGDATQVSIHGLEGAEYIDKVDAGKRKTQSGPVQFQGETDRVYLNTDATCELADPVLRRRIAVRKSGSASTVVWNPWVEKSKTLSDFGDDEWQRMCCIETANAADNALMLPPGGEHAMSVEVEVSKS